MPLFNNCYNVDFFELTRDLSRGDVKALLLFKVLNPTLLVFDIRLDTDNIHQIKLRYINKSGYSNFESLSAAGDSPLSPNVGNFATIISYNKLGDRCLALIYRYSTDSLESIIRIKFSHHSCFQEVLNYLDRAASPLPSSNIQPKLNGFTPRRPTPHPHTSREDPSNQIDEGEEENEDDEDPGDKSTCLFDLRTESTSAKQYFQFYALLSQQQNMMQDFVRTSTYQKAVHLNAADFRDRVVLDVGAGSGILSYFAVQAGAKRVYAVEASNMADFCQRMVQANNLTGRIIVVSGKIEDVRLPEPVDVIISEPMGYMLFNERMLESYVHARKFLRPAQVTNGGGSADGHNMSTSNSRSDVDMAGNEVLAGEKAVKTGEESSTMLPKMFPSTANLYVAPFSDEALFLETQSKASFWSQQYFHGVNLTSLHENSLTEYFSQPVVDTFDMEICMARANCHTVDFRTCQESDLYDLDLALDFQIRYSGLIHGLAFWFDVAFLGSQRTVWLSTAPCEPLTHWYQVRCLFQTPLYAQEGDQLHGRCHLVANERQSYDVFIELSIPGTETRIQNTLDLKNPCFRYVAYPAGSATPAGTNTNSNSASAAGQQQQQQSMDGYSAAAAGLSSTAPPLTDYSAQVALAPNQHSQHHMSNGPHSMHSCYIMDVNGGGGAAVHSPGLYPALMGTRMMSMDNDVMGSHSTGLLTKLGPNNATNIAGVVPSSPPELSTGHQMVGQIKPDVVYADHQYGGFPY